MITRASIRKLKIIAKNIGELIGIPPIDIMIPPVLRLYFQIGNSNIPHWIYLFSMVFNSNSFAPSYG
jgi:hypothetical protein